MYTLYITLCITAGGNALPQLQRKTSHLVLRAVFAAYISLIDVFSDVFRRGTVSYRKLTLVSHIFDNISDKQNYGL